MNYMITKTQAEQILSNRFWSKYVKFEYPGYKAVYGRVDKICIGTGVRDKDLVLITIKDTLYKCSVEQLNSCLTTLPDQDGDTHRGGGPAAAGVPQDD